MGYEVAVTLLLFCFTGLVLVSGLLLVVNSERKELVRALDEVIGHREMLAEKVRFLSRECYRLKSEV